jgi:hypothetical protein
MNIETKIYAAGGILVVLLGGLWMVTKNAKEEAMTHSSVAAAAALPEIKLAADDADKITKIQISNAGKGEVVLEKQGDAWKVTKPVNYPANAANVKSLLDNVKELRLKDSIDNTKAQYAAYDLEDEKAVHVQLFKEGAKAFDLYFGKSGSRGQMTRLTDKDGVYVTSGYSSYLYTRDVKDWRDRDIVKFDDANVVSATITNENGNFSFTKEGEKWAGTFKGKPIPNYEQEKTKDFLRSFKTLAADDFGDGKSMVDTGLAKPAVVTFTLKEGEPIKILVGGTSTGTSRYAMKDGNPTIFTVNSFTGDWATAALSKFQAPQASKDGGK